MKCELLQGTKQQMLVRVGLFCGFILSLTLTVLVSPTHGQSGPWIEWRITNPFPFIQNEERIAELRKAFERIVPDSTTPIYDFERILQDEMSGDRKLGWFAKIAADGHKDTCWDSYRLEVRSNCVELFTKPSYLLEFRLRGAELNGKICEWTFKKQTAQGTCSEWTRARSRLLYMETATVFVGIADDDRPVPSIGVEVTDLFIVGLGDSFGSGEGNPDIPAKFPDNWDGRNSNGKLPKTGSAPDAPRPVSPQWLDTRCHRSMYSYQFKTALHTAFSNPHRAVTFISFACSAAEFAHVHKRAQSGIELKEHSFAEWPSLGDTELKKLKQKYRSVEPQVEALKRVLCPDHEANPPCRSREIDFLLLSIGGNDAEFGNYVADIIFRDKSVLGRTIKLLQARKRPGQKTPKQISSLAADYRELGTYLATNFRIRGCDESECERIIFTMYPPPFYSEPGILCEGDRKEFDGIFDSDPLRGQRIALTRKYVYTPLVDTVRCLSLSLGWTVVTSHSSKFDRHGICAQLEEPGSEVADILAMPFLATVGNGITPVWHYDDYKSGSHRVFPLEKYRAYEKRGRWFRLPVDANLAIAQNTGLFRIKTNFSLLDETAGIFHPTAEGHATMADATYTAIKAKFSLLSSENSRVTTSFERSYDGY